MIQMLLGSLREIRLDVCEKIWTGNLDHGSRTKVVVA